MPTVYSCVPGHEIVGRVTSVGNHVTKYKIGDLVGVGCLVDSDLQCPACQDGLEQFCPGAVFTYGSPDRHGTAPVTYGGYSSSIVVDERFVLRIPDNLDPAAAAPLLCAGITTYSPLRHWKVQKGMKVGIIGLGGLGHMGVKFAHALGADTFVISTSAKKREDALKLGAQDVIISTDADQMKKHAGTFDFLLNCVSAPHDINAYIGLLKLDGTITMVGAPDKPLELHAFSVIFGRKSVAGSNIGGIAETQEMLDFCGQHNITADIELIGIDQINEAYERMIKSDVKYRFCIDMSTLKADS